MKQICFFMACNCLGFFLV